MPHVGVVLSGCGYLDGSEIHEATLTLLSLDRLGATYEGLAPDRPQQSVHNHLDESVEEGDRNILHESARIMRGNIISLMESNLEKYDALIFPGGFGAASNLCSLAADGPNYEIAPDILAYCRTALEIKKPMGFICVAPMLMPFIYPMGTKMTIGNDEGFAQILASKGMEHVNCAVTDIVVDEHSKVVSTPAYMLADNIGEVYQGVAKLTKQVLAFI